MAWNLQQINLGGHQTVDDPFVSVYKGQQHIAFRDSDLTIWDAWYDAVTNNWNLQQINNLGGRTSGGAASVGPFIGVYNDQQHFVYLSLESLGTQPGQGAAVIDAWYDGNGHWNLQQLNFDGNTPGDGASFEFFSDPLHPPGPKFSVSIWTYVQQQHFTYNSFGTINDAFWGGTEKKWFIQRINIRTPETLPETGGPGNTNGPLAIGDPFACIFVPDIPPFNVNGQQHIGYRDFDGTIWDAWYDPVTNNWNLQQINLGGRTNGPQAFGGPFIWSYNNSIFGSDFDDQQHFTYRGPNGEIWDSWYDGPTNRWNLQKINLGGNTDAPAAEGDPFASVFFSEDRVLQQHIAYRDGSGAIWDCFYDSQSGNWTKQRINLGGDGMTGGPASDGDPFVWVWRDFVDNLPVVQQHFTYKHGFEIWDAFWDLPPDEPGGRAGP